MRLILERQTSNHNGLAKQCQPNGYLFFVVVITLCASFALMFTGIASRTYISTMLKYDAQELLSTYSNRVERYPDSLYALSEKFRFDCSEDDQHYLEQISYSDYMIRRISLQLKNGIKCSSFDTIESDRAMKPLVNNVNKNISLWVVNELNDKQQIIVAEWKNHLGSMFVYLEPLIVDSLRNIYCDDCVLTRLTSTENSNISFFRGDASLLEQEPLLSSTYDNGLRVDIYVSPRLMNHYEQAAILPLLLLGATFGMIFVATYRLFLTRRLSLHSLVEQGLARKEFIPYYQPIVNVSNNSLYGCEMLARWQRPGCDMISPMEFIPYVEKSGQIFPITEQLLSRAAREMDKLNWQETRQVISINIVPDQLEHPDVMKRALALLEESNISPDQIAFEVTERKRFTDLAMASNVIEQLRDQGIDVKLDDAGTGYGGFSYIQQLNIRSLKIDKMFVETIGTSDIKLSLLDSIIAFGKEAGMEMIAEGVETCEQSTYLANRGVVLQQGFYFGKPMEFRDFAYYCKSIVASSPCAVVLV
ncbi:EAL domain-containing protein [Photobacterium aquae]|uniref:EAL domain-containing protein n=1 Tax=Photobacterium aquae TaxID=1195763 RepID=UPI00069E7AA9|nr:EAL domain-containing protein [Photobacterium aquae]